MCIYKEWKQYLLWGMAVAYAGTSLGYLLNLAAGGWEFTFSAFSVPVYAAVAFILRRLFRDWDGMGKGRARRRRIRYVLSISLVLGLTLVLGYQIRMLGVTSTGYQGKLFILAVSGGVGLAIAPAVNMWLRLLEGRTAPGGRAEVAGASSRSMLLGGWLAILACWIPAFLAYYPAIMSYDFNRQSGEAVRGYIWFNAHHPLAHTFLIRVFLLLGEKLGSYEAGMAAFSLAQMLVLSCVFAYSCQMILRLTRRRWPAIAAICLFAALPVHPVLAVSMTKDILFTAFFLLFLLLTLELELYVADYRKKLSLSLALALTGVLVILLRNNAIYAMAVFMVFYILWTRNKRVWIAGICVLTLAGGMGAKAGIQAAMHAGDGSRAEMCSVFIQQLARAGKYRASDLSDVDAAMISHYVPYELWEDYNPPLADTVKGPLAAFYFDRWTNDFPAMLRTWGRIGVKCPNEYIDAFLALTSGYWFLDDVSHAEVLGWGQDSEFGLLYTFNGSRSDAFDGVENRSLLPGLKGVYQRIVNGNAYYKWPVLSWLFKPAFYDGILFLVMVSLAYMRRRRRLYLCMLPFWYLMTLFLGPVVHMRYVYPIMAAAPLLMAVLFSAGEVE